MRILRRLACRLLGHKLRTVAADTTLGSFLCPRCSQLVRRLNLVANTGTDVSTFDGIDRFSTNGEARSTRTRGVV